jgi:uncharacterized membrane protein YraQ (UPF0718 family)
MFDVLQGILRETLDLLNAMSPYLLFGFFVAGILHVIFPMDAFARHLGKSGVMSVVKAVILGIPLPLCSCGVIPSAVMLRKRGASRASVLSFLVATPITGVDSIFATFSLMGFFFGVYRLIASCVTALVTGLSAVVLLPKEDAVLHTHSYPPAESDPTCCHEEAAKKGKGLAAKLKDVFSYAFGELLEDVWKWLALGLVIGGIISYAMPDSLVTRYLGGGFKSMLVMMIVGIPMYICATGSIPIAAALMLKGMSPGAAFVFLLAGPATNAVTITVVGRELGKKALAIYLVSIAAMSILLGMFLDWIWIYFKPSLPYIHMHDAALPYHLEIASSIALGAMVAMILFRKCVNRRCSCSGHGH